jgi:hypothetical protein
MRQPDPEDVKFVGPVVDQLGVMQKHPLQVGNAESLLAMSAEYVFFTPAVLYLHAGFTDVPLIDAVYELREDFKLYHKKFNNQIFHGLHTADGNKDWNYVLWAVETPYWDYLFKFIASLTLTRTDLGVLIRVGGQELQILDPLAVDRQKIVSNNLPMLKVHAFGVNGNTFRAGLAHGRRFFQQPSLLFFPPEEDIKVFAEAYFRGKNPINARADFVTVQKLKGASDKEST